MPNELHYTLLWNVISYMILVLFFYKLDQTQWWIDLGRLTRTEYKATSTIHTLYVNKNCIFYKHRGTIYTVSFHRRSTPSNVMHALAVVKRIYFLLIISHSVGAYILYSLLLAGTGGTYISHNVLQHTHPQCIWCGAYIYMYVYCTYNKRPVLSLY
jgi:hypothetical protein